MLTDFYPLYCLYCDFIHRMKFNRCCLCVVNICQCSFFNWDQCYSVCSVAFRIRSLSTWLIRLWAIIPRATFPHFSKNERFYFVVIIQPLWNRSNDSTFTLWLLMDKICVKLNVNWCANARPSELYVRLFYKCWALIQHKNPSQA